jgi:hypothetical protein
MRHSLSAITLGAGLLLAAAHAQAATINFDDLTEGTTLSDQYASIGAVFMANAFSGAGASTSGQSWATNTDMTIVSATGPDSNNLGTPALASGMILGSYNGWLNEDGDGSFSIAFSAPVSSVSADFGGVATGADVAIYAYSGTTLVEKVTGGTQYGQFQLSVSGSNITSVVMTPGSYDDYVAVDNIGFTQAVPEPASLVLMALGLGAVGLRCRRPRA